MPRVKRGTGHVKRREALMKRVRGFGDGRKNLIKRAKTADTRAGAYAYKDRKVKKRVNRKLWQVKINAAAREMGVSYSTLMGKLKKAGIALDRKILSKLGEEHPALFKKVLEAAK